MKKSRRSDSEDRSSSSLSGGSRSFDYSEDNATAITLHFGKDEDSGSGDDDEDDNVEGVKKEVVKEEGVKKEESSDDEDTDDDSEENVRGPGPAAAAAKEAKRAKADRKKGEKVVKADPIDAVTGLLTQIIDNQNILMNRKSPTDAAISLFKEKYSDGLSEEEQMKFIVALASSNTDVTVFLSLSVDQRKVFIQSKISN